MNSYTTLQRNIAKLAIITLIAFISPISAVNAATGNISVVTEVSTPTNDVTPDYTFNSDSTGSIAYTGPCSSVLTTLVSTGNTTITLNSLPEGIYSTCTIQVDNGEGPSNLLTLATFIVDVTAPVVTLSGSSPMTIFSGSTYSEPGASWIDPIYGTGDTFGGIYGNTGSFQSSGSVNTSQTGVYTIEYLKVDVAGNAGSASRTVNVVDSIPADTTAPVVTLIGSATENVLSGSVYVDSGATWSDNIDGTGTIAAFNSGTLNTSLTGTYTIAYVKVDAAGNTGSVTRTVNVVDSIPADTTAPVVALIGSATENVLSGSVYVDSGATWSDNIDGTGTISAFNSGTLNTSLTGTYTIAYVKVDAAGNTGSVTRTVNVVDSIPADTTAPVVALVGSEMIRILSGTTFSDSGAIWSDNIDGTGTISAYNSGTLNTSLTGTYTIAYVKVDAAGNTGSTTRIVIVVDNINDINKNLTVHESISKYLGINTPTFTETFVMNGITYIAIPGVSTTPGSSEAQIIIPSTTGSHIIFQSLANLSNNSSDIITNFHYLSIGTGSYLAAGTTSSGIILYTYSGTSFQQIQHIYSPAQTSDFTSYTISGSTYLGVSGASYELSKIFKWTGSGFIENQSFDTVTNGDIEHFTIAGQDYISVLGYNTGSIYRWSGTGFTTFVQSIQSNNPSVKIFTIGSDTYLVNLDHGYGQVFIYKWNGTQFISFQTLPRYTTGGGNLYIEQFTHSGSTYLIFDTEDGSKSTLYQFIGGSFEPVQYINTLEYTNTSHEQWKYFTIGGEAMLYLSTGGNYKSYIYKWSPHPYVVIKSPISGTLGNNQNWDAGATPISGLGSSGTTMIVADGSGNILGTGSVTGTGVFSIFVSANSGTVLPITVTPYDGVYGEKKTLNYLNITRTPDTTRPIVTLIGSGALIVHSGSTYTDLGASWTDNIDGTGNTLSGIYGNAGSFQSTGTVNTSSSGVYTLTYLKVDAAGNTGSVTRTVTVIGTMTLSGSVSGTGSAVVSTGTVQPGTLVITNGNTINTTGSSGSSLSIPGSVNFLLSGSVWDGILYAPVLSTISVLSIGDAGVVSNLPQDTPTTDYSYTVLPTLMAGATGGTSVIASGGVFTLSMQVNSPSVSSGTSLPIFRSNDSVTWVVNSPQSSCILDSALMCTFTTDHLSYFGFVRVTSTPITATTTTTTSTGPGGGSYSYSYTPNPTTANGVVVDTITNNTVVTTTTPVRTTQRNNPRATTSDSFLDDLFGDSTDNSNTDNSSTSTDNNNNNNSNYTPAVIGTAYVSVKNSLRVRAGTSFNTAVVAYIYRNQEIEVIDNDTPNWSHIQFRTAKGTLREGYILSYYVREMTNIDKIRGGIISFAEATMNMPELTGYINVAYSLNLRSGPSVYTRVKAILKPNTQVIILDTIGKWREIMTEKYHGYVLSKYIK